MKKLGAILLSLALVLSLVLITVAPVGATIMTPDIAGLWHLDDGSGTTAIDDSGNGNAGILYNFSGTYWVDDQWGGKALDFDGVNDYVDCGNDASLRPTSAFTVEAWVKYEGFFSDSAGHAIVSEAQGTSNGFMLYQACSAPFNRVRYFVRTDSGLYVGQSPTLLSTDTWYHLAMVYDGSNLTLYIDGAYDSSVSATGSIKWSGTLPNLYIGSTYTTGGAKFNGLIDEVRIWDYAGRSFNLTAEPEEAFNQVGTEHTVTATVTIDKIGGGTEPAPGTPVVLMITDGPNSIYWERLYADNNGMTTFGYTGCGGAGTDTIKVWLNLNTTTDNPGTGDPVLDAEEPWVGLTKHWLVNFVTGGGSYDAEEGKKRDYTWGGTVGLLPDNSIVGQFQIVDHVNKVSYHIESFNQLGFTQSDPENDPPGGDPPAESPYADCDAGWFHGTGWGNDGSTVDVEVNFIDFGEGKNATSPDWINIVLDSTEDENDFNIFGSLAGGNMQVHEGYKD
jgi:hypothetical protein